MLQEVGYESKTRGESQAQQFARFRQLFLNIVNNPIHPAVVAPAAPAPQTPPPVERTQDELFEKVEAEKLEQRRAKGCY